MLAQSQVKLLAITMYDENKNIYFSFLKIFNKKSIFLRNIISNNINVGTNTYVVKTLGHFILLSAE